MGYLLFRLKFNKLKYGSENVPLEDQKQPLNEAQNFDGDIIISLN
jgi:hypothetical protein